MLGKVLKKLYKKIVGSDTTAKTAVKILDQLADNFAFPAPPAAELPAYTAADSGKVLAVKSDGTLEWKSLS